jgi:SecD/SecF fusion protein
MKNKLYRTIIIYAVLVFTAIYIYPTLGWLSLSEDARQARLAAWKQEDSVYQPPNFWRDTWKGVRRWAEFNRSKVVNLGLDLQGGIHMVLGFEVTPELTEKGFDEARVQEMVLQRVRRRINDFEAKDPIIQAMGRNQIQIQLPGEKDIDRAKNLIMKTAYLTFHVVAGRDETIRTFQAIKNNPKFQNRFTPFLKTPDPRSGQFRVPKEHIEKIKGVITEVNGTPGLLPEGKILALSQPPNPWDPQEYEIYMMDKKELMSGEGLRMAAARPDDQNPGKYQILFEFAGVAANQFGQVTEKNIGKSMAIVLDDVVCSAPTIRDKITRNGQITGNFSGPQANDLAIALNSGSLPVPVHEQYTGVVSASLGADSIREGMNAAIAGVLIVLVFMAVYYRFGGLIANVALFLNGFILLATFAYFGLTLTLPGIAGFVLTLGMAVDANVLIFERIREEVRNGKSLVASIELGYERATTTIVDSNATTLIAALVLLQFGTGPVQGFGVALALGILTSVFTALVVTKGIFDFIIRNKWLKKLTMMSAIPPDTKIPFVEWRNKAFAISIISALIGIVVFFGRGYENNFGVDFAGGTSMIVKLDTDQKVNIGEVRARLNEAQFKNPVVQEYGESAAKVAGNEFAIRTSDIQEKPAEGAEPSATDKVDVETRIRQALAPLAGDPNDLSKVALKNVAVVGPAIGTQLRIDAVKAVMYGFLFQIAYLWFRYNLVWGVTGVIAVFHDTIFAVGMLAIMGRHIDMNVIAAVLTIIGYSINDTVVVYDRIRENLKLYAGRGLTLGQIMNMAINQTLSRTLLTSLCTLLTVIMLLIFGGSVLRDFAICLTIGIICGTYSSIFVASALAYVWQMWRKGRIAPVGPSRASNTRKRARKEAAKSSEAAA